MKIEGYRSDGLLLVHVGDHQMDESVPYRRLKESELFRELSLSHEGTVYLVSKLGLVTEYVHQLQNLYFALTGTELNNKPQPIEP